MMPMISMIDIIVLLFIYLITSYDQKLKNNTLDRRTC